MCYGAHARLARRFVSSLYRCTNPRRFRLRVGLNEVEPATLRLFEGFAARHGNIDLFVEPRNRFKIPLMRRMFHERPVESEWTLWCDDDTHFTHDDWLPRLRRRIRTYPAVSLWGDLCFQIQSSPLFLDWIRSAPWYRGVPFQREPSEEGTKAVRFVFPTGGFWALRTEVLYDLDWPDPRLIQAAEDVLLGEALRQNGHWLGPFQHGVRINDAPRRNPAAPEVREFPPLRNAVSPKRGLRNRRGRSDTPGS